MIGEKDFTNYLQAISSPFIHTPLIKKESLPYVVMLISPHPDDECIASALAMRLQLENNAHIINVAVTLGSNPKRQKARLKELEQATNFLEMELITLGNDWKDKAKELSSVIQKYNPDLIIAPHALDQHPTHQKTHHLLKSVLKKLKMKSLIAWSEYWGFMEKPNLMIEVPLEVLHKQMLGLTHHIGEINRNPYHLRLGAWMIDNVRRGGEIIENSGGKPPQYSFGCLYTLEKINNGKLTKIKLITNFLSNFADLAQIFKETLEAASGSKTKTKRG